MTKAVKVPQDQKTTDFDGNLKLPWLQFFKNLEKKPGAAITDLSASPTNAELATAVNSILAVLRDNGLISR